MVLSIAEVVDWLVVMAGFFTWVLFVPQIRLLLKEQDSRSISLVTVGGSLVLQSLIFIQSILKENWPLAFAMGTSVICLIIIVLMICYYRKYPRGGVIYSRTTRIRICGLFFTYDFSSDPTENRTPISWMRTMCPSR